MKRPVTETVAASDRFVQPPSIQHLDMQSHAVRSSPERSDYMYGHALLLDERPEVDELASWVERWREAFADAPAAEWMVIEWTEGGDAAAPEALEHEAERLGLELDSMIVFALDVVQEPEIGQQWRARPFDSDKDWLAGAELTATEGEDDPAYLDFYQWKFRGYQHHWSAGQGVWFGVWEGDTLIGSGGSIWYGGIARFQELTTHVDYRRQGVCSRLCYEMVSFLKSLDPPLDQILVVAEEGSAAAGVYERLGFEPRARQYTLEGDRRPQEQAKGGDDGQ